jgi:class 3 adenylate cyclase
MPPEAVRLLNAYRQEVDILLAHHHGRLVDFTGDNFLAGLTSALAAVRCAVDIQNVLKARKRALPEELRMEFRLGVHQGEVRSEHGRIFGTGVNIAARPCALRTRTRPPIACCSRVPIRRPAPERAPCAIA